MQVEEQKPTEEHESHEKPKKSYVLLGIEFSLEFIKTTLIVVVIALVLRYFVIQPFVVLGQSMEPNYHDKEYLVIDKLTYYFREPERGEVIIFHPPQSPSESYIKRVIGLPGETVEIKDGKVYINGKLLEEAYIQHDADSPVGTDDMKVTLDEDEYFVFGDNRDHSSDSREIGPIPISNIQGRVAVVLFPIEDIRLPITPEYINDGNEIESIYNQADDTVNIDTPQTTINN